MKTIGNILWHFPFLGFINSIACFILGVLLYITIVGIPIALGLFQIAEFYLLPYSKTLVSKKDLEIKQKEAYKIFSTIVFILYLPFGIILMCLSILQGLFAIISIIGIPVGIVALKSSSFWLNPINKVCVPNIVGEKLEIKKAQKELEKYNLA